MRKSISAFLVTSLFVAPMLAGACAPLEDLGGGGDGGTRGDAMTADGGDNSNNGNSEGGPAYTTGGSTDATSLIYVMSAQNELYSFNPTTNQFVDIAPTNCKDVPHAIAIDHNGNAYLATYAASGDNGTVEDLQHLDLSTGNCTDLSYGAQHGFFVFGMAFSTNGSGSAETLYLQGAADFGSTSGLATLDTNTFELTVLPNAAKPIMGGQLTGTRDGRLFGLFHTTDDSTAPYFGEIDKTNGNPMSSLQQSQITPEDFEVAYWGGGFYFFTSQGYTSPQETIVMRYDATAQTSTKVATLENAIILAAGVSTAAPQ
jgi:hypothetical protein